MPRDFTGLSVSELQDIAATTRQMVSGYEARRGRLSVHQTGLLKDARAELKRVKAELKRRIVQFPLF